MVKVLKSFKSAREAIEWANKSEIENFFIETTGTLKSVGYSGYIPSGKYHVVIKAFPLLLPGIAAAARVVIPKIIGHVARRAAVPTAIGIGVNQGLESAGNAVANKIGETAGKFLLPAAAGALGGAAIGGAIGHHVGKKSKHDSAGEERVSGATKHHPHGTHGSKSVSHEDLVNIITKSVIEVLKSLK